MEFSDESLFLLIKKGDVKSFEKLFDKYYNQLVTQAFARVENWNVSEDIVQDIFIDLWQKKEKINIQSSLKGYLLSSVKYKVYRHIDQARITDSLKEHHDLSYAITGDILTFEELYEELNHLLDKLPLKEQEVFRLSRFQQLTTMEIAEKLNLAPQTVHNKMYQTLRFLRAELKHHLLLL
ncbi:RNA polymerase sigma-70 factor [Belliella sp. DSM 111904]|uniref:RNA polymerase sigma-70 factor n=1 Tax=Belliella filtrata TaxID=2923435 RepID=A0ABS9V1Y6_9BACT|nr:RNA polymerase sigma-70 factor [Belliella filtrata]MCH7410437.1 RNA polymerase sigma-70 factor [Belliella filtrata]